MTDTPPESAAPPDWDMIPFDVGCARCGHDLRGQAEPICPACGLTFLWSEALPVDDLRCLACNYNLYGLGDLRCPECGTSFTWQRVLQEHHRRNKCLFEYQWRRRPVKSLLRTWRLALFPHRLWTEYDLHDPPQLGPLAMLLLLAFLSYHAIVSLFDPIGDTFLWYSKWAVMMGYTRTSLFAESWFRAITDPWILKYVLPSITYLAGLTFGFVILRETMARCRIRTVHLIRVVLYAVPLVWPVLCVLALCLFIAGWHHRYALDDKMILAIAVGALVHASWSLYQAGKRYLRIPHSFGVMIASQVIALLVVLVVMVLYYGPIFLAKLWLWLT